MSAAGLGYAGALTLATVLVAAAVAKARDLRGTEASFAALGLPRTATMARVVPAVEAGTAVVLVLTPALGGLMALALLAFFTTFLVSRLVAGVTAPCSCFGSARREPISPANLVGNGFLVLLAAGALFAPGPQLPSSGDVAVIVGAAGVVLAVNALVRRTIGRTEDERNTAARGGDAPRP